MYGDGCCMYFLSLYEVFGLRVLCEMGNVKIDFELVIYQRWRFCRQEVPC